MQRSRAGDPTDSVSVARLGFAAGDTKEHPAVTTRSTGDADFCSHIPSVSFSDAPSRRDRACGLGPGGLLGSVEYGDRDVRQVSTPPASPIMACLQQPLGERLLSRYTRGSRWCCRAFGIEADGFIDRSCPAMTCTSRQAEMMPGCDLRTNAA